MLNPNQPDPLRALCQLYDKITSYRMGMHHQDFTVLTVSVVNLCV